MPALAALGSESCSSLNNAVFPRVPPSESLPVPAPHGRTTAPISPRAPPVPACRGAGSGSVAWPRVRAMAGGLEPHLEALRRELHGPAVLSVLVALIAVAITFRELREPSFPPAPRPAGGQCSLKVPPPAGSGVPLSSSSSSLPQ